MLTFGLKNIQAMLPIAASSLHTKRTATQWCSQAKSTRYDMIYWDASRHPDRGQDRSNVTRIEKRKESPMVSAFCVVLKTLAPFSKCPYSILAPFKNVEIVAWVIWPFSLVTVCGSGDIRVEPQTAVSPGGFPSYHPELPWYLQLWSPPRESAGSFLV